VRRFVILNAAALIWAIWRRRYLIAVPILVVPILAVLVGLMSTKKYYSHTSVLIQEAAKHNPFLQDLAVATNLKSRMEALNALLHSRHILADVALEQGLISEATPRREREAAILNLSRALTVRLVGDDLIKITLVSNEPVGMRELLAAVSRRFVERVVAPQRSAIASSEAFLISELEKRRVDLLEVEQQLADYKTRFAGDLPNQHTAKINRLAQVNDTLAVQRISLNGAKAAHDSLLQRLSMTNPVLGRVEQAIAQLVSELAILQARYSDRHTKVQAAIRKLESLEEARTEAQTDVQKLTSTDIEGLWNRASTQIASNETKALPLLVSQMEKLQEAESLVEGLTKEVAVLEKEKADLEIGISAFGEHERRLKAMEREILIKRKTYNELAERHQKAQVTRTLGRFEESERVKLIDPPFNPTSPSNLPILLYLLSGIIGGIALGAGLAVTAELLDTSIWRSDSLASLTGVPVLTRIPVLPNEGFSTDEDALSPSLFGVDKMGVTADG